MVKLRVIINGQEFTQEMKTTVRQPSAYLVVPPNVRTVYHRAAPGDPWDVLCVPPYAHQSAMIREATIPAHADPGVAALIDTVYAHPDSLRWWLAGLRTDYFYQEMARQGAL